MTWAQIRFITSPSVLAALGNDLKVRGKWQSIQAADLGLRPAAPPRKSEAPTMEAPSCCYPVACSMARRHKHTFPPHGTSCSRLHSLFGSLNLLRLAWYGTCLPDMSLWLCPRQGLTYSCSFYWVSTPSTPLPCKLPDKGGKRKQDWALGGCWLLSHTQHGLLVWILT